MEVMNIREKVLKFIESRKVIRSLEMAASFGVTRQYASQLLRILVNAGDIIKIGSTRSARYTLPRFADELGSNRKVIRLRNRDLDDHDITESFLATSPAFKFAKENVQSILRYAFSEMLNNAIEHSKSPNIEVELLEDGRTIRFIVNDFGVGVFRNVMRKRGLKTELEAMQDLLKGKTTTAPKAHSGEGIFFTSKAGDRFVLESFGHRMVVDNSIHDVFFEPRKPSKRGTRVIFAIARDSKRHLSDVFRKFQSDPEQMAFDRTEVHVRLFTAGTIHISRSQARRVVTGLEKFRSVILDFDRVPSVGQAFADEVFRVFQAKHPNITITPVNMTEAVRFMVERVEKPRA